MSPSLKHLILFLLVAISGALPLHETEAVEIREYDIVPRDAVELQVLPREMVFK
jgi:hypothetical protein